MDSFDHEADAETTPWPPSGGSVGIKPDEGV